MIDVEEFICDAQVVSVVIVDVCGAETHCLSVVAKTDLMRGRVIVAGRCLMRRNSCAGNAQTPGLLEKHSEQHDRRTSFDNCRLSRVDFRQSTT